MVRPSQTPANDTQARHERWVLPVWSALAIGYAWMFFSAALGDLPPDPNTGLARQRWVFWAEAMLPDDLVANWFSTEGGFTLVDRLPAVLLALGLWVAAWSIGRLVLQAIRADLGLTPLERNVFACGVGATLLGDFVLLLGLAGLLTRGWIAVPLGTATLIAAMAAVARHRRGSATLQSEPAAARSDAIDRWLLIPIVVFAAVILGGAVLPPRDFDVLEYHLQAPKEFFLDGRITFLEHNVYANMPLGAEILSLAAMSLAGDWWTGGLAGKTAIAGFAPLTALLLIAAGRRLLSRRAGYLAALVYLSTPWVALVSANGLVEGASAFYLFGTCYALLLWAQRLRQGFAERGPLVLGGLMAGGAAAVKYPAVVFVVLPALVLVWWITRQQSTPGSRDHDRWAPLRAAALFLLAAAVACGPWYLKNWALTGNPTYPLTFEVFGGRTRTPEKNAQWQHAHRPPNWGLADLLQRTERFALTSDWLNPVALPLAALALVAARTRRVAPPIGGCVLYVLAAWWLLTHRIDRFWVPVLPLVALLAGLGAAWSMRKSWRWALAGWLAVGLIYDFVVLTSGVIADCRYFAPLAELRGEIEQARPAQAFLNQHVPAGSRALLVGDAAVYYLRVPVAYNTVFDSSIFEQWAAGRTPQELAARLAEEHIAYVAVDWAEIGRYRSPGNYGFTEFVTPAVFARLVESGVLSEAVADERSTVYRVTPQSAAAE